MAGYSPPLRKIASSGSDELEPRANFASWQTQSEIPFRQMTEPKRTFYGWWVVLAAFLNLLFTVGIVFYGFPVFYPALVQSLGFTRAQLTQGFLLGFLAVGLLFGFFAGALIDRVGPRPVILVGIIFAGGSLVLMGAISKLWQYYLLCVSEVLGYTLAGPIPNQVLIANWFRARRGRAMGCAYLGLGVGGAVSPVLVNHLIGHYGWRPAFQTVGILILVILLPIGQWVTRSTPREMGLQPDGAPRPSSEENARPDGGTIQRKIVRAVRSANFWLIVGGCTLVIGAIGAVIQHFILFLRDQGYSPAAASRVSSGLLVSSLAGRVLVGYLADRHRKKNVMALFYLVLGLSIPILLLAHKPAAAWTFALTFGFAMGADYMLVPLVVAECFGLNALGKLLALIIMGYSLGQWSAPWLAGRIFDAHHSYNPAWGIMALASVLGAIAIYAVSPERTSDE
jgi:MFS family permease